MPANKLNGGQRVNKGNLTGDQTNKRKVTLGIENITYGTF